MDSQDKPDKHTLAWWSKQFAEVLKGYRGASHGINRAIADFADCWKRVEELEGRVSELEKEKQDDGATIGELQAELKRVAERQDKIAEFVKANVKKNGATA